MAYDETTYRRTDDQPADPVAYRANTTATAEPRRRAEESEGLADTTADGSRREDDGRDRRGIHLGWEVVLLLTVGVLGYLLWQVDPDSLTRPGLDDLLVSGAVIGLLTLAGGLTLRAGVPNLALGPIALAAALHFAEQGDQGLVRAAAPAVLIAAAGALAVGLLIVVLHVPGWAATLAAAFGVVAYDQLRDAPVTVQGQFDPTAQAFLLFGGFALLAVLGGAVGMVTPVRRWLGRMRPVGDPARRRGAAAVLPVLLVLVLSTVLAVGAGILMAATSDGPIVPGTGLEWTGIALGLAMVAGTSAYGRRGGIFGTLFAVVGLALFLAWSAARDLDITLSTIAAAVLAGGLVVTRLVETFGRPLLAAAGEEWMTLPPAGDWGSDLANWKRATTAPRTERWDAGPWGNR